MMFIDKAQKLFSLSILFFATHMSSGGSLEVSPAADFEAVSRTGGGASPGEKIYTLTNTGHGRVHYRVTSSESWVGVSNFDGRLSPGESKNVTLKIKRDIVSTFSQGLYIATVNFTNLTNGVGSTQRLVKLQIQGRGNNGDKPGPNNTGPYDESLLQPYNGPETITTNGALIENVIISHKFVIDANNVTLRNFRVENSSYFYGVWVLDGHQGVRIEDGEIVNVSSAGVYGTNFTARRLHIHECGGDAFKAQGNVLVEDCYIHHLGMESGAHADGNQTRSGSNITIRHNNIDMPIDLPGYESNSTNMVGTESGSIDNYVIEDNWLNGGNYTIYLKNSGHGIPTNGKIVNNRFGRDYRYGLLYCDCGDTCISGNVWDDTGELIDGLNNSASCP